MSRDQGTSNQEGTLRLGRRHFIPLAGFPIYVFEGGREILRGNLPYTDGETLLSLRDAALVGVSFLATGIPLAALAERYFS